ncbi:FirrV-1-B58 precursor [Feldmannia irregularis virus a]|uniref:FirrV-1-B58 n=1 Tax=Feldmannia irregularis virus a TaxID=231992 RepID=Q6XLX8_9PHYC|nr:FirrV-1-B58 precursor [Feldmannia irregularis virus a]AAR26933.1 FirrV-1-B58 precursor [Feldmannia irregularis virus a]
MNTGTGLLVLCAAVALTSVLATLHVQRYYLSGGPSPSSSSSSLPHMVQQLNASVQQQDVAKQCSAKTNNKPEGAGTRWTPL